MGKSYVRTKHLGPVLCVAGGLVASAFFVGETPLANVSRAEDEKVDLSQYYGFESLEIFKLAPRSANLLAGDLNHDGLNDLLLVDNSQAGEPYIRDYREALPAFIETIAADADVQGRHQIALIALASRPTILVDYTMDTDRLRQGIGPEARFRDGQWEAIEAMLSPGRRALVIQKTGWGKSVVYFIATNLLRLRGRGPRIGLRDPPAIARDVEIGTHDEFTRPGATPGTS